VVFTGVFEEIGVSWWCFCGHVVVNWVVIVDCGRTVFEGCGFCSFVGFFFETACGMTNKKDNGKNSTSKPLLWVAAEECSREAGRAKDSEENAADCCPAMWGSANGGAGY
jgi:hypothetical protein